MDLWYVMREPGGFLGFGYKSWEDCISSLIMIGPPGRAARFIMRRISGNVSVHLKSCSGPRQLVTLTISEEAIPHVSRRD